MFQFDQLISGGAQDCVRGGEEAGDGEGCEEGEEDAALSVVALSLAVDT